jgi:hypothetical protein
MTTIELSRNFRINFYPDSNSDPDIEYGDCSYYSDVTGESVTISAEEAKQIITELTKFVEAKEKK